MFLFRLSKKDPNSAAIIFTALEDKIRFVLLLLSHSDDDISESVSDYCQNYIILLKHTKIQNEIQKKHIEVLFFFFYCLLIIHQSPFINF